MTKLPYTTPSVAFGLASYTVIASRTHPRISKSSISCSRSTPDPKSSTSARSSLRESSPPLSLSVLFPSPFLLPYAPRFSLPAHALPTGATPAFRCAASAPCASAAPPARGPSPLRGRGSPGGAAPAPARGLGPLRAAPAPARGLGPLHAAVLAQLRGIRPSN
jgi:hypothetical protein